MTPLLDPSLVALVLWVATAVQDLKRREVSLLVLASLILFTIVYLGLFVMFIALLDKKIKTGPGTFEQYVKEGRRA